MKLSWDSKIRYWIFQFPKFQIEMSVRHLLLVVLASLVQLSLGAEDGLARTPPMGWRSWNAFQGDVDDALMRRVALAVVAKRNISGHLDDSVNGLRYDCLFYIIIYSSNGYFCI